MQPQLTERERVVRVLAGIDHPLEHWGARFTDNRLDLVMGACKELAVEGKAVDLVTVADRLTQLGCYPGDDFMLEVMAPAMCGPRMSGAYSLDGHLNN